MIIESSQPRASYFTEQGRSVLEQVTIAGEIDNLLSRVTITQEYANRSEDNIEAVYTFPLPMKAILTSLEVTIGERKLRGVVSEKHEARNQYEDGITAGDRVIMLEVLTSGMYSMNVGNLQAGERVSISITYAELLRWHDGCLRFSLPTTIAPRYGDPCAAGLEDHQVPEISLLAENRFSLQLQLRGQLKNAEVASPSHQILLQKDADGAVISLGRRQAFMDRDFICLIKQADIPERMAMVGNDYNGYVAMASFFLKPPADAVRQPKNLSLLIDCSGSMGGDSISLARRGLIEALALLEPEDRFNLIAFGSGIRPLHKRLKPADPENLALAKRFARGLEADMGGTEIGLAVNQALADAQTRDIILLTDGEVWQGDALIEKAEKSGRRFFTIGIGSSAHESFVRLLAEKTGGACEMVSPNEAIKEAIITQTQRIFSPACRNLAIAWPGRPATVEAPLNSQSFFGNTLFFFAEYQEKPTGTVSLTADYGHDQKLQTQIDLVEASLDSESGPGTLARIYRSSTLAFKDDDAALDDALKYQLITRKTNYLIIDERCREEKADTLPLFSRVENMLAAGWGGTGTVMSESVESYDIPCFIRRQLVDESDIRYGISLSIGASDVTPADFIECCNRRRSKPWLGFKMETYAELLACRLPEPALELIKSIAKQYAPLAAEKIVVLSFLSALAQTQVGSKFDRKIRRFISSGQQSLFLYTQLSTRMTEAFAKISRDDWGLASAGQTENNL